MIINLAALAQARHRWRSRHPTPSVYEENADYYERLFDENVAFLENAKRASDIHNPKVTPPWSAIHHYSSGLHDVIVEGRTIFTYRVARDGPNGIEIEIIDRDRVRNLFRPYLARRGAALPKLGADASVEHSAKIVAIFAGLAGTVAVIRNLVGIMKDSLDIRKHLRELPPKKRDED